MTIRLTGVVSKSVGRQSIHAHLKGVEHRIRAAIVIAAPVLLDQVEDGGVHGGRLATGLAQRVERFEPRGLAHLVPRQRQK